MKYRANARVEWKWLGRAVRGKVLESFTKPVEREIKGKRIKRNGSAQNPAYLVVSESGNQALKLGSELSPIVKSKKLVPKMFG